MVLKLCPITFSLYSLQLMCCERLSSFLSNLCCLVCDVASHRALCFLADGDLLVLQSHLRNEHLCCVQLWDMGGYCSGTTMHHGHEAATIDW